MQYKAGTNCNNSILGPERKDGALGGWWTYRKQLLTDVHAN